MTEGAGFWVSVTTIVVSWVYTCVLTTVSVAVGGWVVVVVSDTVCVAGGSWSVVEPGGGLPSTLTTE